MTSGLAVVSLGLAGIAWLHWQQLHLADAVSEYRSNNPDRKSLYDIFKEKKSETRHFLFERIANYLY